MTKVSFQLISEASQWTEQTLTQQRLGAEGAVKGSDFKRSLRISSPVFFFSSSAITNYSKCAPCEGKKKKNNQFSLNRTSYNKTKEEAREMHNGGEKSQGLLSVRDGKQGAVWNRVGNFNLPKANQEKYCLFLMWDVGWHISACFRIACRQQVSVDRGRTRST